MNLPQRIILAGFMGTGKSAVGKILAEKLGYFFIDTDSLVESLSGKAIERIFTEEGEKSFRRWESQAIAQALKQSQAVLAVGGGAPCFGNNLRRLQKNGEVVLLKARISTLLKRMAKESHRPLLNSSDREAQIIKLLEKRAPFYNRIALQISTDNRSPEQVAGEILAMIPLESEALRVKLGERSYPIYFQRGKLNLLPLILKRHFNCEKVVLVTDKTVDRLHGKGLAKILKRHFQVGTIVLPPGEKYKNLKTVAELYSHLVKSQVDRKTPILALGGGVIGDVVGFAAATYLRGVPLVQIPTTLLAQVDSSIGGKTGVDLPAGKNLVGAFYQPNFVWIDEQFLATLSRRELVCGMAEVIKVAAIFDAKLFRTLEERIEDILSKRGAGMEAIIRRCCEWKAWVVERDERETLGLRSKLNFGHTLGHAIESLTRYRKFTHGEAIAMGMVGAARRRPCKPIAATGVKAAASNETPSGTWAASVAGTRTYSA